jgi:hypothetical protein
MSLICKKIHILFNNLPRYSFPFDKESIPENGIYILFEKGETAHGVDRIVRVGTHTGKKQLRSRLNQHFIQKNKDRSIFRKNIGRCFLNKKPYPYLKIWDMDFTTSAMKKKSYLIDYDYQKQIERKISKYIQSNFTFAVLSINSKRERLTLESKIVSTVSLCKECFPSAHWLGLSSTKDKIKESGLWQVNELYKTPLALSDFEHIEELIVQ